MPAGSPFEVIGESGILTVRVRRSMLLRTKVDVYRTAIVDESVCDIVQFTPREVSIIGRSQGQTHVTFWFDDPAMPPLTYLVKVEPDAELDQAGRKQIQAAGERRQRDVPRQQDLSGARGRQAARQGPGQGLEEAAQIMTIIRAQGSAAASASATAAAWAASADAAATRVLRRARPGGNPGPAYQIINMLRVPGVQQVALKVKIAELNRTAARGFGVDLNGEIDLQRQRRRTQAVPGVAAQRPSTGGTSLIASFSGDDINIGIRYLQERGVIRLLSEPTLVTLSGRPATFIAGGEFAVPTIVGSVGLNAVTTDFRAFGAIISFLPTIVDKDRIRLQVAPEFSQINSGLTVGGTPGLNIAGRDHHRRDARRADAGHRRLAGRQLQGRPNIGDLPVLAKIFGRRDTTRDRDRADHPGHAGARAPDGAGGSAAAARLRHHRADGRRVLLLRRDRRQSDPRLSQHRLAAAASVRHGRPRHDQRPVWTRTVDNFRFQISELQISHGIRYSESALNLTSESILHPHGGGPT